MKITLKIKLAAEPQRAAVAWWLEGDSVAEWVTELARWPTAHADLQLYAVPGAAHGTTAGVLVIVPSQDAAAIRAHYPAGVAYGRVGDRVYVPVNARFEPTVPDTEVAALLLNDEGVFVWQPARGLIRCEGTGRYELSQLLAIPGRTPNRWDRAVAGTVLNDRLVSIEPLVALQVDDILRAARGEIGTQAAGIPELPSSPDEIRTQRKFLVMALGVAGVVAATALVVLLLLGMNGLDWRIVLLALTAAIVAWFLIRRFFQWAKEAASRVQADRSASGGSGRGASGVGGSLRSWFGGARRWIAERAAALDHQLEVLRHREIDRLLHMLDTRPDEGLRYALPVSGGLDNRGAFRGMAQRGARLMERLVDFSLGRLGGGGPADFWDLGADYHARLVAKYRDLANREIALGRHRRAAYIFAELLGDLRAAAATLADGGHYREAAALYDQRLKDSHAAALCLERGGLLSEAIVFYHGFGNHEKVGELYEKLQQWDFAEQAYRRAAAAKLERQDYLGAAQLTEVKLHQPDEALQLLLRAWPGSAQASLCLEESFKLLARRADHEQAGRQVTRLSNDFGQSAFTTQLATCFAQLANSYPDGVVQRLAADQTRVLAARKLTTGSNADRRKLLQAVQQLVPQDRLLSRDCARFENASLVRTKPHPSSNAAVRVVHEFKLPEGTWRTAIADGDEFYAAGFRDREVVLVRGRWDGTLQQPAGKPWLVPDSNHEWQILMGTSGRQGARILVCVPGAEVFEARKFPKTDWFLARDIGGHPALAGFVLGMHVSPTGFVDTIRLQSPQPLVLISHSFDTGQLISTKAFEAYAQTNFVAPWLITRLGPEVILAGGNYLFLTSRHATATDFYQLPSSVNSIFSRKVVKESLFVALLESGGMVWFGNPFERQGIRFAEELANPVGCHLDGRSIAVADESRIQLYRRETSGLRLSHSLPLEFENPIALLPLPNHRRAALVLQDGRVMIHEFRG